MARNQPTMKQKRAAKLAVENGGNISKAMREAGYSPATAKNPMKLTKSRAWEKLLDEYAPDETLTIKLSEGLSATRVISAIQTGKQASGATTDFIEVPDHAVRHKYLETALKLKRKLVDRTELTGKNGEKLIPKPIYGGKSTRK